MQKEIKDLKDIMDDWSLHCQVGPDYIFYGFLTTFLIFYTVCIRTSITYIRTQYAWQNVHVHVHVYGSCTSSYL